MANLPQRATWKSRRLQGQEPMSESRPANGDNSTPSLHNVLTQRGHQIKTENTDVAREGYIIL